MDRFEQRNSKSGDRGGEGRPAASQRRVMQRLVAVAASGAAIGRACQLVGLVLLGAVLTASDFGYYSLFYGTSLLAAGVASSGLSVIVNRTLSQHGGRALGAVSRLIFVTAGLAAILTPVVGYLATLLTGHERLPAPAALMAIAGVVIFNDNALNALAGLGQYSWMGRIDALRGFLAASLPTLGALAGQWTYALCGFAIGECLTAVTLCVTLRAASSRETESVERASGGGLRAEILRFVIPAVMAGAWVQTAMWIAQLTVLRAGDAAVYGQLMLALRVTSVIVLAPGLLTRSFLSLLSVAYGSGKRDKWSAISRHYGAWAITFIILAWVVVLCVKLTSGYLSPQLQDAMRVAVPLSLAMSLSAIGSMLGVGLVAKGSRKTWILSDVVLGAVALAIVLVAPSQSAASNFLAAMMIAYLANVILRWRGLTWRS